MGNPKISGGYIIISRKIIESEIWDKPPLYIKVWIYLLTLAQHADYKKLKRGQLFTSIPEIMAACSWKVGYRTARPTKDQIYQVIDWLRNGNEGVHEGETKATMITTTKATQGLLINIDNYDYYQTSKNYESNEESNDEKEARATREQRQPDNINKNVKNDKNNNYIDDYLMDKPNPFNEFEKHFGYIPTGKLMSQINDWIDNSQFKEPEAIICETIFRIKLESPRNPSTYLQTALLNLHNLGLFTLTAVKEYNEKFDKKSKQQKKSPQQLPKTRPSHWPEPLPLTEEEQREMEAMEDEFPF